MTEESPRPQSEEDSSEEEEEGEEAAEAPVLMEKKAKKEPVVEDAKQEKASEDSKEEAAPEPPPNNKEAPPEPPPETKEENVPEPPPPEKKAPPPRPLLPAPPAFHQSSPAFPVYHPPAAPAQTSTSAINMFANDGSFLELFKKKMEQGPAGSKEETATQEDKKPEPDKRKPISFVGKRRGGARLALKTGLVAKKPKTDGEEVVVQKGGAWAQYMAEVKKYKAHQCSDDDKTRPLVK